jgi:hypothetical protein
MNDRARPSPSLPRHLTRRLTCLGLLVAAASLSLACGEEAAPKGQQYGEAAAALTSVPPAPGAGLYLVMTRPPQVPAHFVATPNGWFDPDCVVAVADDEHVTAEGHVLRGDGSVRRAARQCQSPRYDVQGRVISDQAQQSSGELPTVNGWVEYEHTTALGALSYVHTQWTVPSLPSSNVSQIIYFFPGLENASNVVSILQPVLGYNHAYGPAGVWSMASWNCCVTGTTWHSATYLPASAGTTVSGDMQGSGCNTSTGVCSNWSIVSRNSSGTTTTLNTTVNQAQNWVFGHVLEAYNIGGCGAMPSTDQSVASGFVLRNVAGTTLATPNWTNTVASVSPSCSWAAVHTGTSATLSWNNSGYLVCTPNADRSCCPYANGCSCLGDQICNASGTGWGACVGAGQAGHPCP